MRERRLLRLASWGGTSGSGGPAGKRRSEVSTPEEHDCECTDDPVCPHCGETQSDFWEVSADSGTTECGHCSRPFEFERHVEVTYNTSPVMGPHQLDEFWQKEELENERDRP